MNLNERITATINCILDEFILIWPFKTNGKKRLKVDISN